ncbi:tetratricopeptide repeat protein 28-like protein [Lates japonicus]|uniref:Tetratricopeptide repeat protein 28-like protein n=1 Tax=Lates japonicus TaxID=270547 RepID=A0AAD3N6E2_LATJO|nr:tetratricopeptide repeat protein 28-like protein [Lates japonicus]
MLRLDSTRALMTLSFTSLPLQAYFRQGVALQYLGRHADALAAFASGLAQDPKSLQLLVGMVEAAMKSPLREGFVIWCQIQSGVPTIDSLSPPNTAAKDEAGQSPFVVVSVIGQELTAGHHSPAGGAGGCLKIGTCSPATLPCLPSAAPTSPATPKSTHAAGLEVAKTQHDWAKQLEIRSYGSQVEHRDLRFTLALSVGPLCQAEIIRLSPLTLWSIEINASSCQGSRFYCGEHITATFPFKGAVACDQTGECRAHGNLGSAFFSKGNYYEALTNHRSNQLVLAMKLKD